MKNTLGILLAMAFVFLFACAQSTMGRDDADAPRISAEELKSALGGTDLVLLDARADKNWKKSDKKIANAVRVDPKAVKSWAKNYDKNEKIVLYCAWPSEGTSASVARQLIAMGYTDVQALLGGWKGWVEKGYPTEVKW